MSIHTLSVGAILMMYALAAAPVGAADVDSLAPSSGNVAASQAQLSADDHLRLADVATQQFNVLEGRIGQVQARIDKFTRKPHLDTKGFKRQSLRRRKGNLVAELREVANKVAWHHAQATSLLAGAQGYEPHDS